MQSGSLANLSQRPLDELLYYLIDVASQRNDNDTIHWAKLELGGYTKGNDELNESDKVPPYRTISGQYYDSYSRPIGVTDSRLSFLLEYPLRDPLAELLAFSQQEGLLEIQDHRRFELIAQKFNVRPSYFRFPVTAVTGVIGAIRVQALERIRSFTIRGTFTEIPNDSILAGLHPRVRQVAGKLFEDGHYRQAILDTYIALVEQVQAKSGRYDLDGTTLMQQVFAPKSPTIIVSNNTDEQLGYMWMFSGAVMGIRNPKAHRLEQQTDPQRAIEWLSFASVLFKVLDTAEVSTETP